MLLRFVFYFPQFHNEYADSSYFLFIALYRIITGRFGNEGLNLLCKVIGKVHPVGEYKSLQISDYYATW